MRLHRETEAAFGAALGGAALPPGLGAEATRRFAVYRNNVAVSLGAALASRFPVIRRLTGAEFFAALGRDFIAAHPPQGPVLHEWGAEFPAFLATCAPLAPYPYMADVARIELARGRAFHAADAPPLDPARLAGADPAQLRLALHPSVIVLALATPAVTVWARNQPGATPGRADLPVGAETALILRDRTFEVPVRAITPAEAALIAALDRGETLAQAAALAPAPDPTPLLVALMRAGALCERRPA